MIVDMWDRMVMFFFGAFKGVFMAFLAWMGYLMFSEIRKAWKMDHEHDRKWTREEYFQHIKEEHPDICLAFCFVVWWYTRLNLPNWSLSE